MKKFKAIFILWKTLNDFTMPAKIEWNSNENGKFYTIFSHARVNSEANLNIINAQQIIS